MDNNECMEKQFYNLMTDLSAIMKNIETYSNRFRIEGVAQNDIIYRNLLQKLVNTLSLLRRNDYFWFIFSAHKCIHASFLDAIGVLIRSKRTFGFQKQAIGILMSTLNRSEHANHLSQFSIGSSTLATKCCWCVGIYNMFFHSVITPTELLFFLDFNNTEIDEPELVPVLLDYAMLFVKMLHADGSMWLITLDRFVDFFERFRLSSPLAANQLGSIKLAKMITLTIDLLKGRISYINHDLVSRILKRVKRSIVELFEERSNNGSNFNTNHDLHEMMKGLFHLISIYASHLQFERNRNPYSAIYFDMIDFYVELVRGLIRNRFTDVSALLLDDLYVTLCMMFNNRMIRNEMLTARQLSIADVGVDILRNSQSFLSKHLIGSILDLGFRCINDSEVALDYIWNNGWNDIEPIWKRHFLASKPDGLNLASDLVCNFSFEIKRLEYLPLLKLFIDTSLEYILAELKKEELTKAPHFFTQRALISIIDASSRLKQPVTFVKPLIDAYASLFKRFDITHWLVSFNNPLYFYVGLLEVRPVRKPCYLDKSEIWSPSFEFILDQFHKYNIEHIDVKSTSSHQLALFAIIEGLIWYYRKSFPANRKSQLLDFLNYIKKDSSEIHHVDIQRLILSLNRIQCSEN